MLQPRWLYDYEIIVYWGLLEGLLVFVVREVCEIKKRKGTCILLLGYSESL